MHTLNERYEAISLLDPVDLTATGTETGVEVASESLDDVMVVMSIGVVSGTTPTLDLDIETSPDDVTYDVAASFGQVTTGPVLGAVRVNLDGFDGNSATKVYLRANYVIAGTTPTFQTSVVALVAKETGEAGLNPSTPA